MCVSIEACNKNEPTRWPRTDHLADGGKGKFSLIQYLKGTLVNQQGYPTRHICYSFTLFKRRYTLYPFNFKKMSSDKLTIGIAPFMKKNNLTSSPCYYTM